MKLLRVGAAGAEKPAMLDPAGTLRDLSGAVGDIDGAAISPEGLAKLAALDWKALPEVTGSPRIGACVARPLNFVCIGLNYADHAAETGAKIPKEPIVFLKSLGAYQGPYDDVKIPRGSKKTDWEVELGVVIGTAASYVSEDAALDHVAGYCVCNDVSEREFQSERGGTWDKGKGCDTFGPTGPWLVTKDEIADPQALDMWLDVDGKRMQTGNTRTMIFGVKQLVSYVSHFLTLHPGDIISTGTPPGVGLGIDETYMVAAGRVFRLGYFDHPPASWWLAWAAARLAGSEAAWVVRLPFILLFALTTLTMYLLGRRLYGARAGLYAAVALNLSPVFGVTSATWVLPDGPLLCALTGAALCLASALEGRRATLWWLAAGLCLGLALFSKYTAALTAVGACVFLLTSPRHRGWLARPAPYLAVVVAGLVFLPVLVWNVAHGWASFAFQGGRAAAGARLHPWGPLTVLGGEALFVLPWIWLPMMLLALRAVRRGPAVTADWFCLCLAAPPILLFAAIAAWSGQRVLFHWADPGYLLLFPLLGDWIARALPQVRRVLWGTAALVTVCIAVLVSDVRWNWLPPIHGGDAVLDAVDWTSVRDELAARGLPASGTLVAGVRWQDCGKLDYAWGGAVPVVCLTPDARQYAVAGEAAAPPGADVLILAPHMTPDRIAAALGGRFRSITPLPPATVLHHGRPALDVQVYLGQGFRPPPDAESSPASAPPTPPPAPG